MTGFKNKLYTASELAYLLRLSKQAFVLCAHIELQLIEFITASVFMKCVDNKFLVWKRPSSEILYIILRKFRMSGVEAFISI